MIKEIFQWVNKKVIHISVISSVFVVSGINCSAQNSSPLFFREDWKEIPAATPVTQEHIVNKDIILGLYGPGSDNVRKSHHDSPVDDPYYVWSGLCEGNWAVTFRNSKSYVDLSGYSKIIWRSKQSGLRCLHLVVKLADGTWLVSSQSDSRSSNWRIHEINIMDINWFILNIKSVTEVKPITETDLSRVDEIGFTDLMTGGKSKACSRIDWIEVYGKSVDRQ